MAEPQTAQPDVDGTKSEKPAAEQTNPNLSEIRELAEKAGAPERISESPFSGYGVTKASGSGRPAASSRFGISPLGSAPLGIGSLELPSPAAYASPSIAPLPLAPAAPVVGETPVETKPVEVPAVPEASVEAEPQEVPPVAAPVVGETPVETKPVEALAVPEASVEAKPQEVPPVAAPALGETPVETKPVETRAVPDATAEAKPQEVPPVAAPAVYDAPVESKTLGTPGIDTSTRSIKDAPFDSDWGTLSPPEVDAGAGSELAPSAQASGSNVDQEPPIATEEPAIAQAEAQLAQNEPGVVAASSSDMHQPSAIATAASETNASIATTQESTVDADSPVASRLDPPESLARPILSIEPITSSAVNPEAVATEEPAVEAPLSSAVRPEVLAAPEPPLEPTEPPSEAVASMAEQPSAIVDSAASGAMDAGALLIPPAPEPGSLAHALMGQAAAEASAAVAAHTDSTQQASGQVVNPPETPERAGHTASSPAMPASERPTAREPIAAPAARSASISDAHRVAAAAAVPSFDDELGTTRRGGYKSIIIAVLWFGSVLVAAGLGWKAAGSLQERKLTEARAATATAVQVARESAIAETKAAIAPPPAHLDLSVPSGLRPMSEIVKSEPAKRTRIEAVAMGRHWQDKRFEEFNKFVDELRKNPQRLDDWKVRVQALDFVRDRTTGRITLELLSELPSTRALDLLYEVWIGSKDRNETTQLAEALLLAKDVRKRISGPLELALNLREKPSDCAEIQRLVTQAIREGDRRSSNLLVTTAPRRNCGPSGDKDCVKCLSDVKDMRKAIRASAARSDPVQWSGGG